MAKVIVHITAYLKGRQRSYVKRFEDLSVAKAEAVYDEMKGEVDTIERHIKEDEVFDAETGLQETNDSETEDEGAGTCEGPAEE